MSELQKDIIDRLLKEQKKSKRDLAKFLNIKENSVNRTLKSPGISVLKLEKIAEFLEIELSELIEMKSSAIMQEERVEYQSTNTVNKDQSMLNNLSEVIRIQGRTIEIMAEAEKTHSKNLENMVKLLDRYSDSIKGDERNKL